MARPLPQRPGAAPRPSAFPRNFGRIRRLTWSSTTPVAAARLAAPSSDGASATPSDHRFAKRLFHSLIKRPRLRRLGSAMLSAADRRFGRSTLSLISTLASSRFGRGAARMLMSGLRLWLIAATPLHLAARAPVSALQNARILNLLFRSDTKYRRSKAIISFFVGLFEAGEIERIVAEIGAAEIFDDPFVARLAALSLLQAQRPADARRILEHLVAIEPASSLALRLLGRSLVAEGRYDEARAPLAQSVALDPSTVMAYQNSAARYDPTRYSPAPWELADAGRLLIADVLARHAEELSTCGALGSSIAFYRRRMLYQKELAAASALPSALQEDLRAHNPGFDPVLPTRILPYEWVTQIGHLGMLDVYAKMTKLDMLPKANQVLLAPADKVANAAYLDYVGTHFCTIHDAALIDALFPYQRQFGANFMAIETIDNGIEPWTVAAARAVRAWNAAAKPPLLSLSPEDREFGQDVLRRMGLPHDAWYVGLHVRESGFYGESDESIGSHRNARVEDSLPAVAEIVRRGGWVIRLGDPSMTPLPGHPHLIDYAHSEWRSPRMDVFLMATCRLFVGTTSGLTTALQAFDTPMLLVNCISNDWQFWPEKTRFMTKRIRDRLQGRYLSWAETYSSPIQGILGNRLRMEHRGYRVEGNTPEEIREAVEAMLDRLDGASEPPDVPALDAQFRRATATNPLIFGAALPAAPFVRRHGPELIGSI